MDRKMSEKEISRFMKLAGLLTENQVDQVVDKVEDSLEAKLDQLSPEQIQKLQADLAKMGITADTAVEDAAQKIQGNLDEVEGDDKKKLANALQSIGTGLVGSILVPIIPVAIGQGTGLGTATGLGITLAAGGLLVGLAKALKAKSGSKVNEDDYSEDPSSDMDDESQSGDTDAMGISEAGNVKGIKIEIPGNSNAADFGKAAAREVIESFGPREYKYFISAFLEEFKKLTGGM